MYGHGMPMPYPYHGHPMPMLHHYRGGPMPMGGMVDPAAMQAMMAGQMQFQHARGPQGAWFPHTQGHPPPTTPSQ